MKHTNKLTLLLSIFAVCTATMLNVSKTTISTKAEGMQEVVLPSSVTNAIYRYAKAVGDSSSDVDKALKEWLDADDNLSGLAFFESDPIEYNSAINRKIKDCFYVIAYLQQYILNETSTSKGPIDAIRETLDHAMEIKNQFIGFIDSEEEDDFEGAYVECKILYEYMRDMCENIEKDIYHVFYESVETFVRNAKRYLQKSIDKIETLGFDQSLNKYAYIKNAINGFGTLASQESLSFDEFSTEVIDYVLFDENTKIDSYFSTEFIDYDELSFSDALIEASLGTEEEYEEFCAPYIEKMDRQLVAELITYNFAVSYIDNPDSVRFIMNNCGPLSYKLLDYVEAKRDNDPPNIVLLGLQITEDLGFLLHELDLDTNKQDLAYEKYIANMRLGSLAYKEATSYKFSKFLDNIDKINSVTLEEKTYEQGVAEINALLNEGYKNLNVDTIASSEQAILTSVDGLEDLASREQAYSFELKKSLQEERISSIRTQIENDYGDDSVFVNTINVDMVLIDKNVNQPISDVDDPIAVSFIVENLKNGTDVKIYRYDTAEEKVISLGIEETQSKADYFDLNGESVCIHTKELGIFAVAYINSAVKQEIEELRDDIEELQSQISALNTQISTKNTTITQLQNKITQLEGKVAELESDATVQQSVIESLQSELSEAKTSLDEKIVEISNFEKTIKNKNSLIIVFIILSCVFAASTIGLTVLYLNKKKKEEK